VDSPPQWRNHPAGQVLLSDFYWITAMADRVGEVVFHDFVVCVLERQNFGADL